MLKTMIVITKKLDLAQLMVNNIYRLFALENEVKYQQIQEKEKSKKFLLWIFPERLYKQ